MEKNIQESLFLEGEGDAWFERNNTKKSESYTVTTRALGDCCDRINNIVEIGCADAMNLEALCGFFGANGFGIDPSNKAINAGILRTQSTLDLRQGVASSLPYEDDLGDIVIFGFCLYLNDRSSLFDALNEADRILNSERFLVITDFDPGRSITNPYKHCRGLNAYKEDYAQYFIDKGYFLIEKHSYSHGKDCFDLDADERISTQILMKP